MKTLIIAVVTLLCSLQPLQASNFCEVDLNSYGLDDLNHLWTAWIKVNNEDVFTHTYDSTASSRGINTVVIDPSSCATSDPKSFDTCADANAATTFNNYVKGLAAGTVLIGVTSDEPQSMLAAVLPTLNGFGMNLAGLNYRGKFLFVTVIGQKANTVWAVMPSGGANLHRHVHINSASKTLRVQNVCVLDLNAYGLDDNGERHTSWIKVNGETVFTNTYGVIAAARGVNTVELDPNTCVASNQKTFDTYNTVSSATDLVNYVKGLKAGTVLVGVTSDEPQTNLATAIPTLNGLGIDLTKLDLRGKFLFLTEIGNKANTISAVSAHGGHNLHRVMHVKVAGGACRFERVCQIQLHSYGLEDVAPHTSWVRVDGTTVFTNTFGVGTPARGINTVLLDAKTCTTSDPRSFDTAIEGPATTFANYVKGLKSGTVLASVTSDEPQGQLSAAAATLNGIGLNLGSLNYRGKFVFITQYPIQASTGWALRSSGGYALTKSAQVHGQFIIIAP